MAPGPNNPFDEVLATLPKTGVFISHISEEQPLEEQLERYIRRAFGDSLPVFRSTNQTSIRGGKEWHPTLLSNLAVARVVLVMLSRESSGREWINFEAGVGIGARAEVIPLATKRFALSALDSPLRAYHGRTLEDIDGILSDIAHATRCHNAGVDRLQYLDDIRKAETGLVYKNLILAPFLRTPNENSGGVLLSFAIENRGNVDIDLLMLEVMIPLGFLHPNYARPASPNVVDWETAVEDGKRFDLARYYSVVAPRGSGLSGLRPVLTRSMGRVELSSLRLGLQLSAIRDHAQQSRSIHYQIFARDYDTTRETILIRDIPYA